MSISPTQRPPAAPARWRAMAVLFGVFVLGLGCGLGGGALWVRQQSRALLGAPGEAAGPATARLARVEGELVRRFDLTPEQRAAVRRELGVTGEEFRRLRIALGRDTRRIVGDSVVRTERALPPEKRAAFRAWVQGRLRPWGMGAGTEPTHGSDD